MTKKPSGQGRPAGVDTCRNGRCRRQSLLCPRNPTQMSMRPLIAADVPRYRPLLIVLAAACAGIMADCYCPLGFAVWSAAAFLSLCIWGLLKKRGHHRAAACLIFLAIMSAAGAWNHYRWNLFEENDLGNYTAAKKQPVALEAIVLTAPRQLPSAEPGHMQSLYADPGYRLEISAKAIRGADKWQPVSGRALLFVQGDMAVIEPGDRIRIFGDLSAPSRRTTRASSIAPPFCVHTGSGLRSNPRPNAFRLSSVAAHGVFPAGWKACAREPARFSSNISIPDRPNLPRLSFWASANKSIPSATSRLWPPARSIFWRFPDCTWAY